MKKTCSRFFIIALLCAVIGNAAAGEPITLTLAAVKIFTEDSIGPLCRKYEEQNPGIKINFIQLPSTNNSTEVHQWLVTNMGAMSGDVDVVALDCIWFPEFASAGWLLDIGQYFPVSEREAYFKGTIDTVTYKGKIYGVPWMVDGGLLYYRKDLLDKYSISPPETWEEMIAACKKIMAGENNPKLQGFVYQAKQAEIVVCDLVSFLGGKGAVFDAEGKCVINNQYGKRAAAMMHDLIFKHQVSPREVNTFDEEPSRIMFTDGNAIFLHNWTYVWNVAQNDNHSSVVGKVGARPLPHYKGDASASCLGGYQWAASAAPKHPREAADFMRFLSSYDSQKHFHDAISAFPPRMAVFDHPDIAKDPFMGAVREVFKGSTPRPITPVYPEVSLAIQNTFSKICSTEEIDIDAELDALAAEIEEIVSQIE